MTETEKDQVSKTVASLSECISIALDDIKKLTIDKKVVEDELASLGLDYCRLVDDRDQIAKERNDLRLEAAVLWLVCATSTGVLFAVTVWWLV